MRSGPHGPHGRYAPEQLIVATLQPLQIFFYKNLKLHSLFNKELDGILDVDMIYLV